MATTTVANPVVPEEQTESTADVEERDEEERWCCVCWEVAPQVQLLPCGHAEFCPQCTSQLWKCPLCRALVAGTLDLSTGETTQRHGTRLPRVQPPGAPTVPVEDTSTGILRDGEYGSLVCLGFGIWFFIFIGGRYEWLYDVPRQCGPLCMPDECHRLGYSSRSSTSYEGCLECKPGTINGGMQCFESVTDLPPVETAAGLKGPTYFFLIVAAQVAGASAEVVLIKRLRSMGMMPPSEMCILVTALTIEILRMLLVDIFMLQQYLAPNKYSVFDVGALGEVVVNATLPKELAINSTALDEVTETALPSPSDEIYYIATHADAYNPETCTLFSRDSALLDYGTSYGGPATWRPQSTGGHPRFSHLGWAFGGEFCMYYFLATVINEFADCLFVVPTHAGSFGWKCKVLSVVLEVFQLGVLFPAAAFNHTDCIEWLNPMGVDMHIIRDTIVLFGYCIWGSVLIIGACSGVGVIVHGFIAAALAVTPRITARWGRCGRGIDRCLAPIIRCHDHIFADADAACGRIFQLYLAVLSLPMFVAGTWLGVLVIVGQGKKQGHLNFITAMILLFDVGFKVGATISCEIYDLWFVPWRQRRRQRAAEARRAADRALVPAHQSQSEHQLAASPPRQSLEELGVSRGEPAAVDERLGGEPEATATVVTAAAPLPTEERPRSHEHGQAAQSVLISEVEQNLEGEESESV